MNKFINSIYISYTMRSFFIPAFMGVTLLFSVELVAQNIGDIYTSGRERILSGIEKYEEQKYTEAVGDLVRVTDGDSLYHLAQYELALCYIADSQYMAALPILEGLLQRPFNDRLQAMNLQLSALDYSGDKAGALKKADEMIARYGYTHKGFFEKAGVHLRAKENAEALALYQQSLRINYMHPTTHLRIGVLAAKADQPALAIMAIYFATIVGNNEPGKVISYLQFCEKVGKNQLADDPEFEKIDPAIFGFAEELAEINEIVLSKVALSSKYKSKLKTNDVYARQLQVICERLPAQPTSNHPLMQFYMTFFKAMWDQGQFIGMAVQPLAGFKGSDYIEKLVAKNKKKIDVFAEKAGEYLIEKYALTEYTQEGEQKKGKLYRRISGPTYIAPVDHQDNSLNGFYTFFHENNEKSAEGKYVNNDKVGEWRYYSSFGYLRKVEEYKAGKLHGKVQEFTDFGIPESSTEYKDGEQTGELISYQENGAKSFVANISNGQIDGTVKKFDDFDQVSEFMTFKMGKVSDKIKGVFPNGQVKYEIAVVNEKKEGPVTYYSSDGKVETTGQFTKDLRSGEWKWYYPDGTLKEVGNYTANELNGLNVLYDKKGNKTEEVNYKDGRRNGLNKEWDPNGKMLVEVEYRNGKGIRYTYYDVDGKILSEAKLTGGKLPVTNYNDIRIKSSEGIINKEDREGEWKIYYDNGALHYINQYKEGKRQGLVTEYYPTGQIKGEYFMVDDENSGFYRERDVFGRITEEGYLSEQGYHGPRIEYHPNGAVSERSFYWMGKLNGMITSYRADSTMANQRLFHHGFLLRVVSYDKQGKPIGSEDVNFGNGTYKSFYPSGNVYFEVPVKFGEYEGLGKEYNPDGSAEVDLMWVNGKREGYMKIVSPLTGLTKEEGMWKNGQRDGEWKFYDSAGLLNRKFTYQEGKRIGKGYFYFRSGKTQIEADYEDDLREGVTTLYADDGTIALVLNYRKGVLLSYSYLNAAGKLVDPILMQGETGAITGYYPNGKKSVVYTLKNGEWDGEYSYFHTNGKVSEQGVYSNGEDNGKYAEFASNGQKLVETNYEDGNATGKSVAYYENGKVFVEETYAWGFRHGPASYYDKNGKLIRKGEYFYGDFYEKK
jgi:uncharacterized protein